VTTPYGNGRAETWPKPFTVTFVAETGSTNADLLAAGGDLPDGTVLVADRQTAGRGRLDRSWESPPDERVDGGQAEGLNLLMSMLFRVEPAMAHDLVRRVAIAAARACERVAGVSPTMKWPNDLLLGDEKLAGILAQAGQNFVVVGIGLNVAWAPDGAARLPVGSRDQVLQALLEEFASLPSDISSEYRERLGTLGRDVRVELVNETFLGRAIDVTPDGGLIVRVGDKQRIVTAGDVIHLRLADG
jgi:BirA family transcriptional regulator, biotin operon repressor / biotin---[acetyl-CoA-carboxylase] ligase